MADEKPVKTRTRAKRRDYKSELEALRQYCEAAVEILTATLPQSDVARMPEHRDIEGKIAAFTAVLKRMEAK